MLETMVLTCSLFNRKPACFDDYCEELAVHFSVDVSIPPVFLEWLRRIGGRAKEVLEVLGHAEDPEDDQPHFHVGPVRRASIGQPKDLAHHFSPNGQLRADSPAITRIRVQEGLQPDTSPTHGKRRRVSLRQDSKALDQRYVVEFDSPTISRPSQSSTKAGEMWATPPLQAVQTPESMVKLSPKRKRTALKDGTIVLETPPKAPTLPSRSSTPGCSQKVQSLSLESDAVT